MSSQITTVGKKTRCLLKGAGEITIRCALMSLHIDKGLDEIMIRIVLMRPAVFLKGFDEIMIRLVFVSDHMAVTRNRGLSRSPPPPPSVTCLCRGPFLTLAAGLCVEYCNLQ